MASAYRLHKPYVLASLPRPLDHTDGRVFAREVYGQRGIQKKRRTELIVGIDGETASIYDIPESRLITSYPIPPQESFTCPPYSIRVRRSGSSSAARYTVLATKDAASYKISLCKDVADSSGKTISSAEHRNLGVSPVKYITSAPSEAHLSAVGDIIAVCENGDVICLSGESLVVQWTAHAKSTIQDISRAAVERIEVEYVTSATVTELREGLFKTRPEVFTALPKSVTTDPTVIVLITRSFSHGQELRYFQVLAAASSSTSSSAELQKLTPLDVVPIASDRVPQTGAIQYQVDIHSGQLLQLQQNALSVYDLSSAVPKLKSVMQVDEAESFTRLSRPFILSCSPDSIGLYNYQYRSVHAHSSLDLSDLPADNRQPQTREFICYMRSQDTVIALFDNLVVGVQVEPPQIQGKRRRLGMLIDSISRGTPTEIPAKRPRLEKTSPEFSRQLPGTMTEDYVAKFHADVESADTIIADGDIAAWDELLRTKFQLQVKAKEQNGDHHLTNGVDSTDAQQLPEWDWHLDPTTYPTVDRRWILYAITRVFSIRTDDSQDVRPRLGLDLSESNVTTYLAVAGHLSISNLRSAFREEVEGGVTSTEEFAEDLIGCLREADPSLSLLYQYLRATRLGEMELVFAIRAFMLSMDLLPATVNGGMPKLLGNEPQDEGDSDQLELDNLERELAITEHLLGDEDNMRARGINLAFTKLWRLPARSTVKALRTALNRDEIPRLLHILRVELTKGAWTSLYNDETSDDSEGNMPSPDGAIALIGDLMGRCLDAIGSGGWLHSDSGVGANNEDVVTSLTREVASALEGVQSAIVLNGLVGESLRYGLAAQNSVMARHSWNISKPIPMPLEGREARRLPLGLKTKQLPTKDKVVSGGEVMVRTTRETGHLISQSVEAYSLEKLAV